MKKSEWEAFLKGALEYEDNYQTFLERSDDEIDFDRLSKSVTQILLFKGWLPPARTEHGITKHDWEPEDE